MATASNSTNVFVFDLELSKCFDASKALVDQDVEYVDERTAGR